MSKVFPPIKAMLTTGALLVAGGVMYAAIFVVIALWAVFVRWLIVVFRYYPNNILIPTIGEAYVSFPAGKELLLGGTIICFCAGLFWYPYAKREEVRWEKKRALAWRKAMAEAQPGEAFFYFDRKVLRLGLILGSVCAVLGFGGFIVPIWAMVETGDISRGYVLAAGLILCWTVFASFVVLVCLRYRRHHGPALIIGSTGIGTARSGPDAIPWREISRVECDIGYIKLRFLRPGRLRRSLLPYQFLRTKLPWLFGYRTTKLMVFLSNMSVTQEDVVLAIRNFAPEMDLRVRQ